MKRRKFLITFLVPLILGAAPAQGPFRGFSTTLPDLNGVYVTLSVEEENNDGYSFDLNYRNEKTNWNNVNLFRKTVSNIPFSGSIKSKKLSYEDTGKETIFSFSAGYYYKNGSYFDYGMREFKSYNYNNFTFLLNNEGNDEIITKNKFTSTINGIEETKYGFKYENFYSDIDSNNYREIDISSLRGYPYKNPDSIYIYIKDENNIFNSELIDENTGLICIPLLLNNGCYEIKDNFKLYVDPISRHLSFDQKDNYIRTNHFYLPINTYEKTDKLECSIHHYNFDGYGNNFIYNFTYYIKEEFYGSCHNSTYCLGINRDNENNDLEKIYEVVYD